MAVRLEHANLVVRNIDEMIQFLKVAFPEFRILIRIRGRILDKFPELQNNTSDKKNCAKRRRLCQT